MDPKKDGKERKMESAGVYYEVVNTAQHPEPRNVFVICFDREGSEHNVIDRPFALGLARALLKADQLAKEGRIDVVVMCSAKNTSFVAGADIKHELQLIGIQGSISAYSDCTSLQVILAFLQSLPVPTIAVVAGTALGGGMELMLAADYRIVDPVACKQIGLPEVKLGVLPGGGGAVWLPRMIGFRRSLPLLLTGSPITPSAAHSLGIVDYLLEDAGTVAVTEPSEAGSVDDKAHDEKSKKVFDYRWVAGVTRFVEEKVVLKSMTVRDGKENERGCNCDERPIEEIVEEISGNWERSEVKFANRFPPKRGFHLIADYLYNVVVYLFTLIQLWWKLGRSMPAPFVILQTAFASLYIGSHKDALSLSARNFAQLATSAESTSIMGLFLVTRALRKYALNYGLRETLRVFEKEKLRIIIVISRSDRKLGTALIQGLLYAGVSVTAILVYEEQKRKTGIEGSVSKVRERIRKLFDYAVKRGYLKHKEVDEKMKRLDIYGTDWEENIGELTFVKTVVINASFTDDSAAGDALEKLQRQSPELVVMEPAPGHVAPLSLSHSTVLVNWGDPVRKKTLSVELSPANDRVPHACIRIAAQVVSSFGKTPVFTPYSSSVSFTGSVAHHVTLHHWALAARLVGKGLSDGEVDSYARKAGYTKGPLATMKQLDKAYLSYLLELSDKLSLLSDATSILRAYLTNSLTVTRACKQGKPSADDVSILFYTTNMKASVQARRMNEIPEYAIDFLCVSGLVGFPPSEGGPLNYLARNGKESIIRRLQKVAGSLKDEVQMLDMDKVLDNVHELFGVSRKLEHNSNVHDKAEAVSDMDIENERRSTENITNRADTNQGGGEGVRSDGVGSGYCSAVTVLSAAQLERVGPTRGLDSVELLLYPLPMLLAVLAVGLLLFTVITCWVL